MRKLWSCLFYSLCVFTIVFSLYWMTLPQLTRPSAPSGETQSGSDLPAVLAQASPGSTAEESFYLCDEGGRVAVYRCGTDGQPADRLELTDIYVNLLPESDALRLKQGFTVQGQQALASLLEDLGG